MLAVLKIKEIKMISEKQWFFLSVFATLAVLGGFIFLHVALPEIFLQGMPGEANFVFLFSLTLLIIATVCQGKRAFSRHKVPH